MNSNATINISGNVTKDPIMKMVNSSPVLAFTVAVNDGQKKENGEFGAMFFNCSAWGPTATYLANRLQKGTHVSLVGALTIKPYIFEGKAFVENRVTVYNVNSILFAKGVKKTEEEEDDTI